MGKLNVKGWDNEQSTIDKQVEKEVRNQKFSKLDKDVLAYDQDKIERAERKFDKVERKKEDRLVEKNSKNGKNNNQNVFQKHAEGGWNSRYGNNNSGKKNKFYKK